MSFSVSNLSLYGTHSNFRQDPLFITYWMACQEYPTKCCSVFKVNTTTNRVHGLDEDYSRGNHQEAWKETDKSREDIWTNGERIVLICIEMFSHSNWLSVGHKTAYLQHHWISAWRSISRTTLSGSSSSPARLLISIHACLANRLDVLLTLPLLLLCIHRLISRGRPRISI